MPTFNLGTATVSARVADLIKGHYERMEDKALTGAQVLALIRGDIRDHLARQVAIEKSQQRAEATRTENQELDSEVTV